MSPKQSDSYYLLPNLQAMDASTYELDFNAQAWIQPIIIIEDEDLMFGGKPLSAWYEEDRSRLSSSSGSSNSSDDGNQSPEEEEERRGRERTRRRHRDNKAMKKPHRK